jgi:hypothetical protein
MDIGRHSGRRLLQLRLPTKRYDSGLTGSKILIVQRAAAEER